MRLPFRPARQEDRKANVDAVTPHFPHNLSAKLMDRGVDEQATKSTGVTRLRNVWPASFFPN
jgi:hypothetical protein